MGILVLVRRHPILSMRGIHCSWLSQRASNAELWCSPQQIVEETMELPVIWDVITLKWRKCNGCPESATLIYDACKYSTKEEYTTGIAHNFLFSKYLLWNHEIITSWYAQRNAKRGMRSARLLGLQSWCHVFLFMSLMMTSSNGNIFRVTGALCGEFTGHRWIPFTKASDTELWCFYLRLNKRLLKTIAKPVIWDTIALIMTSL